MLSTAGCPRTPPSRHEEEAVGLLDKLKGVKRPDEDIPVQDRAVLRQRLDALASDQVPFVVADGDESCDLLLEWRIVDAQWYEVFAKSGVEKSHRILLVLAEGEHQVRALEQAWWSPGPPAYRP